MIPTEIVRPTIILHTTCRFFRDPYIALVALLNEALGNDAENLFDALAVFGVDFMAAVPAFVLCPVAAAAFGIGAVVGREGRGQVDACDLFGDPGDGALEGDLAARGVFGY
jgi:hypothetical protein